MTLLEIKGLVPLRENFRSMFSYEDRPNATLQAIGSVWQYLNSPHLTGRFGFDQAAALRSIWSSLGENPALRGPVVVTALSAAANPLVDSETIRRAAELVFVFDDERFSTMHSFAKNSDVMGGFDANARRLGVCRAITALIQSEALPAETLRPLAEIVAKNQFEMLSPVVKSYNDFVDGRFNYNPFAVAFCKFSLALARSPLKESNEFSAKDIIRRLFKLSRFDRNFDLLLLETLDSLPDGVLQEAMADMWVAENVSEKIADVASRSFSSENLSPLTRLTKLLPQNNKEVSENLWRGFIQNVMFALSVSPQIPEKLFTLYEVMLSVGINGCPLTSPVEAVHNTLKFTNRQRKEKGLIPIGFDNGKKLEEIVRRAKEGSRTDK